MLSAETIIEAETCTLTGGNSIQTSQTGYTGSGYVGNFPNSDDEIQCTFTAGIAGYYNIRLRYLTFGSSKHCYVKLSEYDYISPVLKDSSTFTDLTYIIKLQEGTNNINIVGNWGWFAIDHIGIEKITIAKKDYSTVTQSLINPNANDETKDLYKYLRGVFGKAIISGHTDDYYDDIFTRTTKKPAIKTYDFGEYSLQYAYDWCGSHCFGPVDNGLTESIISDYNDSNQKLIVSIQWHWFSPCGCDTPGTNTWRASGTTFDVRQAVISSTTENNQVISDIDAIAVQLLKLQDAKVPVLWRPLHEADGAWFWWGKHGKEPCLQLWDIMYDRLTNHHGLNNLIWNWNRADSDDWYPGNDKVDMYTLDTYTGSFNYDARTTTFNTMWNVVGGKKLLGIAENGPIPDIDVSLESEAPWLYFMTWSQFHTSDNSDEHLNAVYKHYNVITLDKRDLVWKDDDPFDATIYIVIGSVAGCIVIVVCALLVLSAIIVVILYVVIYKNPKKRKDFVEKELSVQ